MKVFCILAVSVITLVTVSCEEQGFGKIVDNYKGKSELIRNECIKESTVDPEVAKNMLLKGQFPDNIKELKCYTKCIMLKTGIINDNGEIVKDVLRKNIGVPDETIAEKVFQKCKDIVPHADACETTYEISKCVYQGTQEAVKNA